MLNIAENAIDSSIDTIGEFGTAVVGSTLVAAATY